MFLHEDLTIYTNQNFRSFEYIKSIWDIIENDLLYIIGMIDTGNITIVIDPGVCYITVTSNFVHIFDKRLDITFNHSVNVCEDFSIEIKLLINRNKKDFYLDIQKSALYFQKNKKNDEGIVEYSAQTNFSIDNFYKFRNEFILSIVKEIQYSIHRNILDLDIIKFDAIISEIDAEYELIKTYSNLYKTTFNNSLNYLLKQKKVFKENKEILLQLLKKINKS